MATYDDYDGVYFSVQAIRLYHPEVTDRTEILVLDNHPSGPCAKPLKDLERQVAGYRYVPYERSQGTAVRDLVFREANAEFVLCMDSHVLFRPGALARLVEYLAAHPDSCDLWQGPADGRRSEGPRDPLRPRVARRDVRGVGDGPARSRPRCARVRDPDAGAGGVRLPPGRVAGLQSPAARVRRGGGLSSREDPAGRRPDALPAVPRLDAPVRPAVRAALPRVAWTTGCETTCSCTTSWASTPARRSPTSSGSSARSPCGRWWSASSGSCGGRFTSSTRSTASTWITRPARWESVMRQCKALGIDHRIRRFAAIDTPTIHDIGRALSHRAIVAEAKWQGLDNVLVLEDDVVFSRRTADVLARSLAELREREWRLLSLGASCGDRTFPRASGCRVLQTAQGSTVAARGRLSPHRLRPDPDGRAGHAHGHGALAPDPPGDRSLLCSSGSAA